MIVTNGFGDLLDKAIRKIYFETYDRYPTQYTTVLTVDTAESAILKESSVTGMGMAKDMNESEEIPEGTTYQGYDVSYTVNKIGDSIKVTKEMLEEADKINMELQQELADLSTNGTLVVVEDTGHYIQFDQPDAVIDAVRKMVESLRE